MADSRVGKKPDEGGPSKKKKKTSTKKKVSKRASAKQTRSQSETRKSRREDDRVYTEDRVVTDEERLNEFRKSFFQSVLPDLPEIPGYHVCWLTTTNPRDPIQGRVRLGYEPVKAHEIPGWEYMSMKSGEYEGCIGVNEMVAFKLPNHLYEAYMAEAHHHQPQHEEDKLSSIVDVVRERAASEAKSGERGIRFDVEEGSQELGKERDVPRFSESSRET